MKGWTARSWPFPNRRSAWPWCWHPEDAERFIAAAGEENLEATPVAVVTAKPRLIMHWRGRRIVDIIPRHFLDTNGVTQTPKPQVPAPDERAD